MRNAFIKRLGELAEIDPRIVLIVGDLGFSVVEDFATQHPQQFINAGIAEQNMMGMAAGLASEGFRPFVYSIGNFPTYRCAEQIRNDVDYLENPVVVVAVGGGLSYGNMGYSHHAIQDYALMRSFPNTIIAAPADALEVEASLEYLLKFDSPGYLRLGKVGAVEMHKSKPQLKMGEWLHVAGDPNSSDVILSTGAAGATAIEMLGEEKYSHHAVFTLPIWGRAGKMLQSKQISRYKSVTVVEDHLEDGGFGSWILEASTKSEVQSTRIHLRPLSDEVLGAVGTQDYLNRLGH